MAEFKIAEGYVEVNARVNERQVRDAANEAGGIASKAFADESDRVAKDRNRGFFRELFTPNREIVMALRTGIPAVLGSPIGAAAISLAAVWTASFVGAVLGSGALLAIGGGFTALAAVILAENERVASAFSAMAESVQADLTDAASSMIPVFTEALQVIHGLFEQDIAAPLEDIFEGLAPTVVPMITAVSDAIRNMLDILAGDEVLAGLQDFLAGVADDLPRIGTAVGNFFAEIAEQGPMAAHAFSDIVTVIENFLGFAAGAINTLTQMFVGFGEVWDVIGVAIEPVAGLLGDLIGVAADLHPVIIGLGTALAGTAVAMRGFGTASKTASTQFVGFSNVARNTGSKVGGLRGILGGLVRGFGPLGLAISIAGTALLSFSAGSDEAEKSVTSLDSAIQAADMQAISRDLADRGLLQLAEDAGLAEGALTSAFADGLPGVKELIGDLDVMSQETKTVTDEFTGIPREVFTDNAHWAGELRGRLLELHPELQAVAEEQGRIGAAADEASAATLELAEELGSAFSEGLDEFSGAIDQYEEVLERKEEKEREAAEATADATEDSTDTWEDHVNDVTVSIDDLIAKQDEQIAAMENWAENIALLAAMGIDEGFVAELAAAGPKSAPLVQALVDAPEEKRGEYVENWLRTSQAGSDALAGALAAVLPRLESIATTNGEAVAQNIAAGLATGEPLTKAEALAIMDTVETEVEGRELLPKIEPFLSEAARGAVENALNNLARNRSMSITPHINPATGRHHIPSAGGSFASGGVVGGEFDTAQAGGPRGSDIVVNDGIQPEAIRTPNGSLVIPSLDQAFDRNQMAGASGGVTVNLYVQGSIRSDRDLVELIRDEMLNGGFRGALEGAGT